MPVQIVGIVFTAIIVIVVVQSIASVLRAYIKRTNQKPEIGSEETHLLQDIYQGLKSMEKRVDALETILLKKKD